MSNVQAAKPWWPGDPRVEPFMIKINDALDRNEIIGDARVDIYNRCYEAVYSVIKAFDEVAMMSKEPGKTTADKNDTHENR